ncbi:unnamed protein product [Paramecium primaurelia]|uniref:RING-type domain-containing protein n=2 Tax=Paramecium primaurelia TaxID=5886 RepID=A0A8S1LN94_PARPR|nr:unnamed protein product [Paramecium primaurelia]
MASNEARLQSLQNWKASLELKKILNNQGIDHQNQDYLAQLTYKIAERAFGSQSKNNLESKVCEMVEQQTCAICFELMVPPQYSPILLFPCGHSFCKSCVLDGTKLRIQKCSLCRSKISAHAINLSLQNLICTFAEQKQQIPKQTQQMAVQENITLPKENAFTNQYKMYKLRCDILEQEKQQLNTQIKELKNELVELERKVGSLQSEREKIISKQAMLQNNLDEVNQGLQTIVDRSKAITVKIYNIQEQMKILDETMKPLQQEMNKYEVLAKST